MHLKFNTPDLNVTKSKSCLYMKTDINAGAFKKLYSISALFIQNSELHAGCV